MRTKLLTRYLLTILALFSIMYFNANAQAYCDKNEVQKMQIHVDHTTYQELGYGNYDWQYPDNYLAFWTYGYIFNMPFTFCFDNAQYSQISWAGGWVVGFYPNPGSFPYAYGYYCSGYYGTTYYYSGIGNYCKDYIMAWGGYGYYYYYNGYPSSGGYSAGYKTLGSSPNRVMVFEWRGMSFGYGYYDENPVNCQIKLYETSNKIELCYGHVACAYDYYMVTYAQYQDWYFVPLICICGKDGPTAQVNGSSDWMQIYPPGAGTNSDWQAYYSDGDQGMYGPYPAIRTAAVINNAFAQDGLRITIGKGNPAIINTVPYAGQVLRKGSIFGGSGDAENHPAVFVKRDGSMPTIKILYELYGPGNLTQYGSKVIYQAKDPLTNSIEVNPGNLIGDSARYDFTTGTGVCFGTNGVLDLYNNQGSFSPGQYYVASSLDINAVGYQDFIPQKFTISLSYDLTFDVYKPLTSDKKKYPLATTPIWFKVANIGINTIHQFEIYALVYQNGKAVSDTLHESWTLEAGLAPGQDTNISVCGDAVGWYPVNGTGDYSIHAWMNLLDATDQDYTSNVIPRSGAPDYVFSIVKESDIKAHDIVTPSASKPVTVKRPMLPSARFTNEGVDDMDFDTVFFTITYGSQVVYRDTIIGYVITAGTRFDTTLVPADKYFVAPYPGTYQICARIVAPYDDNPPSQKIVCTNFNAQAGLLGDYTVGVGGDFATINAAVQNLYQKGVSGNVRFLLTDRNYTVGDTNMAIGPAVDLSSYIPGLGSDATVSFIPSPDRAVETAGVGMNSGVTIKVLTGSGIGILLGQNWNPTNPSAIVLSVSPTDKAKYSNSAGYFTFDGGQNKSILFSLITPKNTNLYTHNVFYLQQGSQNDKIKNCLFVNNYMDAAGNARVPNVWIPKVYSQGTQLIYMADNYLSNTGYSAAIVMRAQPPKDPTQTNSQYMMDTIPINNIDIEGNDISGFGYGVVDYGNGPLLQEQSAKWVRYYNHDNIIKNNVIHSVSRAGIWLGYTENEMVTGNRIYNVSGAGADTYKKSGVPVTPDAGGILAGGDNESTYFGFNNVNLSITGNEISAVSSNYVAYGIKVEQSLEKYGQDSYFPNTDEQTLVMNNIVWGMLESNLPNLPEARVGIRVYTRRAGLTDYLNAFIPGYYTTNDRILSNTVIMPDDGGSTKQPLAGIAVQNSKDTKILNNAVSVLDNLIDASCPVSALIFYEGLNPSEPHGIESNRNAFWRVNSDDDVNGPAMYGYIEQDINGNFIDPKSSAGYDQNAYETIRQWRNWTRQDMNSVVANFTNDLETVGSTVQYLRIKTPSPTGSVLNDRGFRLNEYLSNTSDGLNYDMFGTERGKNGQLFDIGAQEFEGGIYLSDIEFVMISSPSAYKSGSGLYADAEHIMTTLPVTVKAIFRNSGNLFQAGANVRLEFTDLDGGTNYTFYDTLSTDIVVAQSKEISFNIPDSLLKTYTDLKALGYNPIVPSRFSPYMESNVTPRYQIKVEAQADENNSNNIGTTTVRFYLRRANHQLMMISADYANADIYDLSGQVRSKDEIAGRLNYDALQTAFDKIGWYPAISKDIDNPGDQLDSFKVDVFDRMSWEPKAVDYTMYKYLFWSDRNDMDAGSNLNQVTRQQQGDINKFLSWGATNNKRNLVIGSQETVRNLDFATNSPNYDFKSTAFVNNVLRSMNLEDGYAFGEGTDCNLKTMRGVMLEQDKVETIRSTGKSFKYKIGPTTVTDDDPNVGLVSRFDQGDGLAKQCYTYEPDAELSTSGNFAGMTVTNLTRNIVYIAVDWRHMNDPEGVVRSVLDYYDKNGGTEVPIEMVDFNAKNVDNRVEVSWATLSELNSDRFEVEKAELTAAGKGSFNKIGGLKAAGTSSERINYGPVEDREVKNGGKYIYRLKMIDKSGSFAYSDEKMVEIGGNGLWLGQAVPNPVNTNNVSFEFTGASTVEVYMYDAAGRKIVPDYKLANGKLNIVTGSLGEGAYTVIVRAGDLIMTRQIRIVK